MIVDREMTWHIFVTSCLVVLCTALVRPPYTLALRRGKWGERGEVPSSLLSGDGRTEDTNDSCHILPTVLQLRLIVAWLIMTSAVGGPQWRRSSGCWECWPPPSCRRWWWWRWCWLLGEREVEAGDKETGGEENRRAGLAPDTRYGCR